MASISQAASQAEGKDFKAAQKNATSKQYDLAFSFTMGEVGAVKPSYTISGAYSGVPYGFCVAVEARLQALQNELTALGAAVATGGETPPSA